MKKLKKTVPGNMVACGLFLLVVFCIFQTSMGDLRIEDNGLDRYGYVRTGFKHGASYITEAEEPSLSVSNSNKTISLVGN